MDVNQLKTSELKGLITQAGLSFDDCSNKDELRTRAREALTAIDAATSATTTVNHGPRCSKCFTPCPPATVEVPNSPGPMCHWCTLDSLASPNSCSGCCGHCGKPELDIKFQICSRCLASHEPTCRLNAVKYCGKECQVLDWKARHKRWHMALEAGHIATIVRAQAFGLCGRLLLQQCLSFDLSCGARCGASR